MRHISLIPYVCSAGGKVIGSERGALDLYQSGLAKRLQESGLSVGWQGDPEEIYASSFGKAAHEALPAQGTAARNEIVLYHCRLLKEQVSKALAQGNFPVTLGGDHAMAAASISAVSAAKKAQGNTGVIWVDAHADVNTPATSPSQALHGMPLGALLGMGDADYVAVAGNTPVLKPEHIVYIGLRDVDPGERDYIAAHGITAFSMDDIRRLGVGEVFERAQKVISSTKCKAMSIDLDAFDPAEVPATGSPVPGGLKVAETLPVLKKLAAGTDFDLIEVAEYNPMLRGRDQTAAFIEELLKTLLS